MRLVRQKERSRRAKGVDWSGHRGKPSEQGELTCWSGPEPARTHWWRGQWGTKKARHKGKKARGEGGSEQRGKKKPHTESGNGDGGRQTCSGCEGALEQRNREKENVRTQGGNASDLPNLLTRVSVATRNKKKKEKECHDACEVDHRRW